MRSIPSKLFWLMLLPLANIVGCSAAPAPEPKPPEVEVALPIARTIVDYEEFTGRLDSVDSVQIKARVSGYLDAFMFKEGDEVKEGDTLIQIDPRPYQAQLAQDQADLANKQAVLVQKEAVAKRSAALLRTKSVSQEDYDNQKGDYEVARAGVGQAEAKLKISQLNLDWTQLKAPVSGRVGRALVTRGNLVAADNTLLTSIVSLDPMWLYFTIDERTLLRLRSVTGAYDASTASDAPVVPVEMGLANEKGYSLKGKINFEDNKVDPGTGTILMRGVFANPKTKGGVRLLSPGLFARVRLTVGNPRPGMLVADRALGTDQGKKYLYVVQAKTNSDTNEVQQVVERRYVEVGDLHGGLREIKTENKAGKLASKQTIAAQERLVVSGLQRIRPGAVVTPKVIEMPASSQK